MSGERLEPPPECPIPEQCSRVLRAFDNGFTLQVTEDYDSAADGLEQEIRSCITTNGRACVTAQCVAIGERIAESYMKAENPQRYLRGQRPVTFDDLRRVTADDLRRALGSSPEDGSNY